GLYPDQEEALIAICERTIRAIADHLRHRQIQVVLLTVFPYGDVGSNPPPGWSNATYRAVGRVNATLRTLSGPGLTVVDCDPVLAQANGRRKPAYPPDLFHLNP